MKHKKYIRHFIIYQESPPPPPPKKKKKKKKKTTRTEPEEIGIMPHPKIAQPHLGKNNNF